MMDERVEYHRGPVVDVQFTKDELLSMDCFGRMIVW
jgi:hypothetical protein